MTEPWAGMDLGRWAGLGFVAPGSLDLRSERAEDAGISLNRKTGMEL